MPTSLSGQLDLGAATEGTALASNTDVASFTDANTSDTASAFAATIDWGDGVTTTGTVVGSNGSFTVEGGHTYADEGFPTATVNVTRTADNSQLGMVGTIAVDDADNLTGHSAPTIAANPNQALTNVTVATFTDSYTGNTPSDFTTAVDWGDGTTTSGVLSGSGGNFTVTGSHTYAAAGQFTITTFMNDDDPNGAFGVATTIAGIGFGGNGVPLEINEGTPTGTVTTATFSDNAGLTASDYTATIDWGDGSTTTGTVSGSSGAFSVSGSHTYADEGNFTAVTEVIRQTDSQHIDMPAAMTVDEADILNASGTTIQGDLALSNVTIATFTDTAYTGNVASDFVATINWGDGTTTAGIVTGSAGAFSINGTHTYAHGGSYTVSADVKDDAPGTAEDTAQTTANVGLFSGAGVTFTQAEGAAGTQQTAVFNDGNTSLLASDFTATINWGDGTTSTGTVSGSAGSFTVSGTHAYADEGSFTTTTTVKHAAETLAVTASATSTEADSLSVSSSSFIAEPGQALANVIVATFSDTYLGNIASDLLASINWGDGTTSAGTISGSSGNFTVMGSHTYTSGGNFSITTTASDDAPGTATASGIGVATVNLPGTVTLTSATEHVATGNVTVATFTDSSAGDQASDFTATINWADGTSSNGTVSGGTSPGTFSVAGNHTYADEGNFAASVTLTRTADQASSTVSGSVAVAEHDSLSAQGVAISGLSHHALNGVTVATFTDTDHVTAASDFVATIDWGDGTISAGTVAGANGQFAVNGSHTYAAIGHDTVSVTVSDDAPGTATASATSTATIASGAGNLNDFNADTITDVLWQNTGGSLSEWLMQGGAIGANLGVGANGGLHFLDTGDFDADSHSDILWGDGSGNVVLWAMNSAQILSRQTVGNVGSEWQNQGVADFNGDGHADVLWRNSGTGQVVLWTMNGGTITSNQSVGTPGAEWHIQGLGDFNGDGNSDVLLRSSNTGQLVLWTMNGSQITANQSITNLGLDWHVLGTGDFNGDGHADILLRNDNSQVVLLTMNGNHIVANQNVGNIDTTWHLQGINDYTGDGHADALWRNDSGQVALWEMNGNQIVSDHQVNYASGATNTTDNSWSVLHHAFDLV